MVIYRWNLIAFDLEAGDTSTPDFCTFNLSQSQVPRSMNEIKPAFGATTSTGYCPRWIQFATIENFSSKDTRILLQHDHSDRHVIV